MDIFEASGKSMIGVVLANIFTIVDNAEWPLTSIQSMRLMIE